MKFFKFIFLPVIVCFITFFSINGFSKSETATLRPLGFTTQYIQCPNCPPGVIYVKCISGPTTCGLGPDITICASGNCW